MAMISVIHSPGLAKALTLAEQIVITLAAVIVFSPMAIPSSVIVMPAHTSIETIITIIVGILLCIVQTTRSVTISTGTVEEVSMANHLQTGRGGVEGSSSTNLGLGAPHDAAGIKLIGRVRGDG